MPENVVYYSLGTRRGRDVAEGLGAECYASRIRLRAGGIVKAGDYVIGMVLDFFRLLRLKPSFIIVEQARNNLMLLVTWILKKVTGVSYGIDCHTAAYCPADNSPPSLQGVKKKLFAQAKLVIVHNTQTLELSFIHNTMIPLESRVPKKQTGAARIGAAEKSDKKTVTFITRFHRDEPIELMLETAQYFGNDWKFFFTGNCENRKDLVELAKPDNIIFTGFLSDQDYNNLLAASDLLVVLTTRDYTLLYGGREAIAYEKPVVMTGNRACRDFFTKGTVFVKNTKEDLSRGIQEAYKKRGPLTQEIRTLASEKETVWDDRIVTLKKAIDAP